MRKSREEAEKSRQRIVREASVLVRREGPDGTSVAEVMGAAGMTHGGFYKHFGSKEALIEAALDAAFDDLITRIDGAVGAPDLFSRIYAFYLSDEHVEDPAHGCPAAATGTEIARGPASLKERFGAGVRRVVERLAESLDGPDDTRLERAYRTFAAMLGAVILARASDLDTRSRVLSAVAHADQPPAVAPPPTGARGPG